MEPAKIPIGDAEGIRGTNEKQFPDGEPVRIFALLAGRLWRYKRAMPLGESMPDKSTDGADEGFVRNDIRS
jgi:hypothetical protein